MGLSLLAPAFLLGLLALAVPVLVHLIHRERSETVVFPSLMFLRQIPYRSIRRQKIRHWLLFLLRCAALILLAAAFARPFLARENSVAATVSGARELVVLLDRSYSMGHRDRWPRALAAARQAVSSLGSSERATVVLFDESPAAVTQATGDRATLAAAIDAARLGSGITRYGPAIKLARKILEESTLPRREVVLITDFQRSGWDPDESVRLPPGTVLTRVDLSDPSPANVSVSGATLARERAAGRELVTITARLSHRGTEPVRNLSVALELDGRQVQTRTASLEANGAATVTFTRLAVPENAGRGAVRLGPDDLPQDNVFHFTLAPTRTVGVLVLESNTARSDESLYLRRALALGERPLFRVETKRISQFQSGDLAGRSVVVLNDVAPAGPGTVRRLAEFVSAGGGLLVALGERVSGTGWQAAGVDLLPAGFGRPVDRTGDWGGALGTIDFRHPVFEIFSTPRSGDFSTARFFRYRPLEVKETAGVLARFDDGSVALVERTMGKGRILVWTSTLDGFWSDLALKPVYLPFVHQLTRYLARYAETRPWFTVGQVAELAGLAQGDVELVATAPSGTVTPLPGGDQPRLLPLPEQGFYEVRNPRTAGTAPFPVAANVDLSEADLGPIDPDELASAITGRGVESRPAGEQTELTPEDRERRQSLWWYLLAGVLLLLLAETTLSNRLSRAGA